MALVTSQTKLLQTQSACSRARRWRGRPHALPFGFGKTKEEVEAAKDEEFRAMQEVMRRRKTGEAIKEASIRRAAVKKVMDDKKAEKAMERELLSKGIMPETLKNWQPYDEKTESNSRSGIVVPLLPFGIQKYDEGERFDLRNPFSETGYVDPDELTPWDSLKRFGRKVFDFTGGKMVEEDATKEIYVPDIKKVGKGKKGKK